MTLSIISHYYHAERRYAEYCILFIVYVEGHHYSECGILLILMLNVIILYVIMMNEIILSVVMLNAIMLNVVAPFHQWANTLNIFTLCHYKFEHFLLGYFTSWCNKLARLSLPPIPFCVFFRVRYPVCLIVWCTLMLHSGMLPHHLQRSD